MPGFNYTRNQPIATDDLQISQQFLFNNTNGSDDSFGVNHVKFSDNGGNSGKHNFCEFVKQGSDPSIQTGEIDLYGKDPGNGITELFVRKESGGNPTYQLTTNVIPSATEPGFTFLPGAIIIQWGVFNIPNNQTQTPAPVNFPIAFPSQCFVLTITPDTSNIADNIPSFINLTNTGFIGNRNSASGGVGTGFSYIAIGK